MKIVRTDFHSYRNEQWFQFFTESKRLTGIYNILNIEVRRECEAVYRQIVERIEALILLNGEALYADFVNELNNLIRRNNNILAARKGRGAASKEGEDKSND
jgi:hypothetical protein